MTANMNEEHFVVFVNGNHGTPADGDAIELKLREMFAGNILVHKSQVNTRFKTHDGIDMCGARLSREIEEIVRDFPKPRYFSMVSHSLGGLIARAAIRDLFQSDVAHLLEPVSFVTMASPHLGSRLPAATDILGRSWGAVGTFYCDYVLGATGRDLRVMPDETGVPLLRTMSDPSSSYMSALRRFRHRVACGAVHDDLLVPFTSATICAHNPHTLPTYNGFGFRVVHDELSLPDLVDGKAPVEGAPDTVAEDVATVTSTAELIPEPPTAFVTDNLMQVEYDPVILRNLSTLSWRRIAVEFSVPSAMLKLFVHTNFIGRRLPTAAALGASMAFIEHIGSMLLRDHRAAADPRAAEPADADDEVEVFVDAAEAPVAGAPPVTTAAVAATETRA